ncbi:orotidine-5'-phosphate decarboxylase [Virgibacillus dakarensis]|uniref:Orotidine 5'-phosphate decarboxylase n=1 Tax=Lentibacillus populi TaxID=1827502 RepID=A0A9W5X5N1_9BACI|nr:MULTISPECIES: orotidine-5'-phosphate decarboxylase [Bacillaceae]MBT2216909.1 orotidine-5'-phosphate decarboxylase [Virgibacillus dakarensis]MTW85315.1 orotidine-5'-phosphate decarboxylase [Virgibacillus dakarensis]GGB45368.1 orotidine 5'-phosphate decarboxylase [Lentibacillus populi]
MNQTIYLSLDFPTWNEAKHFIDQHDLYGVPVKVGMELFYREGPDVIEKLKQDNHAIFLDLKLHDIPTTVRNAMKNLARLEVDMVNVHALGGSEMIQAAKEGLLSGSQYDTKLIAVTILTSMDHTIMNNELLIQGNVQDNAVRLSEFANRSGADGVVCSVHEAKRIKAVCGSSYLTVTPGIRLQDAETNDQKRVATPAFARKNGSDILVVGRTITNAQDPKKAYNKVVEEWNCGAES